MKKIFTLIVILFPILSVYETYIPKLSIADAILLITLPIFVINILINNNKKNKNIRNNIKQKNPIILFLCYIIFTLLIQMLINTNVGILSTFRYSLYLCFLLLSFDYFDFKFGINILGKLTLIVSIYVILQFISYIIFSRILPWYIPGLTVIDQNFIYIQQTEYYLTQYRPTGIFMEPTHFVQFVVVYLTYLLFFDIEKHTQIFKALVISAAVIVSGSSLGLILLVFVWFVWFIKKQKNKFSPIKLSICIIFLLLIVQTVFSIDYFQKIVTRMFVDNSFSGAAVGYRFDSLKIFKDESITILNWIIGFGRSSEETYLTGVFYFLNCNGIVGLIIYLYICLNIIFKNKGFARWLTITILMLSIGSEFMANFGILFYLSFVYGINNIYFNDKKDNIIKKEVY